MLQHLQLLGEYPINIIHNNYCGNTTLIFTVPAIATL